MLSFNQFIINEEKKNSDIQDFIKFAASKLGLKDLPSFDLNHDAHSYRSFGGYSEDGIGVATKNRHTMDVCRTIAHELVHYKQDKDGKLKYDGEDGKAGSPMENEANAKAAVIMRAWADERPELFKEEKLGKIQRTPGGPKKFAVKVKNDKGNVVTVRFGDPNMEIKRDDPKRRKSFRARHHCDTDPGPRWKARYWSCKQWRAGKKVEG